MPGEIHNIDHTLSVNTGLKGTFGDSSWSYEALFGHSQNSLESKWPALVSAKAQALYLGPSLGIDPDSGYNIYNAPISRLYTPLTVAQFRSITQDSIDNDKSRSENRHVSPSTTPMLLNLPARPVGFAGVVEYGNQYFGLKPDPLSLDGTLLRLAQHRRGRLARSCRCRRRIQRTRCSRSSSRPAAGRYDSYEYSGTTHGKFTYSLGLEYRPINSLLLRGSVRHRLSRAGSCRTCMRA